MPVFPKPAPGRLRISLLSLLLLTTCIAMGLGLWLTHQRAERFRATVRRLEIENLRLRNEYGEFTIEDPSLLHAVRLHAYTGDYTGSYRDWSWHVAVPQNSPLTLRFYDGLLGKSGLPKNSTFVNQLQPGRHTIRLSFRHEPSFPPGKRWRAHIQVQSWHEHGSFRNEQSLAMSAQAWPKLIGADKHQAVSYQIAEGAGPAWPRSWDYLHGYPTDKPCVLQRFRLLAANREQRGTVHISTSEGPEADAPGFLIWLEPAP